jgi:hypothetical protein
VGELTESEIIEGMKAEELVKQMIKVTAAVTAQI